MEHRVSRVARMAGVSVRALHHYDRIGLLKPSGRSQSGYRLYAERDLLRLQQILFYRELEVPLRRIREILDAPSFDGVAALAEHRALLEERGRRAARLIETIDRTLARLRGGREMLSRRRAVRGLPEGEGRGLEAGSAGALGRHVRRVQPAGALVVEGEAGRGPGRGRAHHGGAGGGHGPWPRGPGRPGTRRRVLPAPAPLLRADARVVRRARADVRRAPGFPRPLRRHPRRARRVPARRDGVLRRRGARAADQEPSLPLAWLAPQRGVTSNDTSNSAVVPAAGGSITSSNPRWSLRPCSIEPGWPGAVRIVGPVRRRAPAGSAARPREHQRRPSRCENAAPSIVNGAVGVQEPLERPVGGRLEPVAHPEAPRRLEGELTAETPQPGRRRDRPPRSRRRRAPRQELNEASSMRTLAERRAVHALPRVVLATRGPGRSCRRRPCCGGAPAAVPRSRCRSPRMRSARPDDERAGVGVRVARALSPLGDGARAASPRGGPPAGPP